MSDLSSTPGLAPLPPRACARANKRRRRAQGAGDEDGSPSDAPASNPAVAARAAGLAGLPGYAASSSSADASQSIAAQLVYEPVYACEEAHAHTPECMHYEFLDHTADVQIHSWGARFEDACVCVCLGMYGYMTDITTIVVDPTCSRIIRAEGHDAISLVYNFMDACLYQFATDDFIARDMKVLSVVAPGLSEPFPVATEGAGESAAKAPKFSIAVAAFGERFQFGRHPAGTEIKAITYSNMQIVTPHGSLTANEPAGAPDTAAEAAPEHAEDARRFGEFDLFVIVDI